MLQKEKILLKDFVIDLVLQNGEIKTLYLI